MNTKNNKIETNELLEFLAKTLSWGYEKNITPLHIFTAYQLHLLTKISFKECVETAYKAGKTLNIK